MTELKLFKFATIGLLLLNIGILSFFWFTRPQHPPMERPKTAKDILELNDVQQESFMELVEAHKALVRTIDLKQQEYIKEYLSDLTNYTDSLNNLQLLEEIQELHVEKIKSIHQHFLDVKSMLKPPQEESFDAFIDDAIAQIIGQRRKRPKRPKD